MPRHRTIRPNFAQTPAVGRLSRNARLLCILMWTLVDDTGRLRWQPDAVIEQLYPFDADAPMLLAAWLEELEREGFVEAYDVDGQDYLRVLRWRQLQTIQHPSRSRYPKAPHESHETHEESPKDSMGRASKANPHEEVPFSEEEAARLGQEEAFSPPVVRGYLRYALQKSLASDKHTAPARYIELMGRDARMWAGKGAPVGRKEPAESRSPSPAELHRLPETRASD